jgi:hypothetical protein
VSSKTLTKEQVDRLNAIDFEWQPGTSHSDWDERYQELIDFLSKHDMKDAYNSKPSLSYWIKRQRGAFRSNKLSQDRVEKLNRIKFEWNPKCGYSRDSTASDSSIDARGTVSLEPSVQSQWDARYHELAAYKSKHGNLDVRTRISSSFAMGGESAYKAQKKGHVT